MGDDEEKGQGKNVKKRPMSANIERGSQIANRLFWEQSGDFEAKNVCIGCECRDKKLHAVMEFNLEEYGVQKQGIEWIEYVAYRGFLVWDIWALCRSVDEVFSAIRAL